MGLSTLISVAIAAVACACAYLVIRLSSSPLTWLRSRPIVTAAGKHGAAGWGWLTTRIAAQAMILVAGGAVVFALAAVFTEILDAVVDSDDLTVIDRPVSQWLVARRDPGLTRFVLAITNLGGAQLLTIALTATAIAVAWRLRTWRVIGFTAVTIGGILLLITVIKALIGRDRPTPADQIAAEAGYSFPSGHSASSLVGFALIAWLICMCTDSRNVRATAWLTAFALTTVVGISRVYLGVHFASDVIGGWVLGLTWLAAVALAVQVWPGVTRQN